MVSPQSMRSDQRNLLQSVVSAARQCFARYGVHRTRMEDVAAAAGLARSRLYKLVTSKDELIELALMERSREYSEQMRAVAERQQGDIAGALVEVFIYGIAMARSDEEFSYLAEAIRRTRLQFLLTGTGSPMHGMVAYAFEPLLTRARVEKRLRPNLAVEDIVHWFALLLSVLTPSEDVDEAVQRRLVERLLVPAVLA